MSDALSLTVIHRKLNINLKLNIVGKNSVNCDSDSQTWSSVRLKKTHLLVPYLYGDPL